MKGSRIISGVMEERWPASDAGEKKKGEGMME